MYEAVVTIKASDENEAWSVYKALVVEAQSQPSPLVSVDVRVEGCLIVLAFASQRRSSLRAALNSFFRLLATLENVVKAVAQVQRHGK